MLGEKFSVRQGRLLLARLMNVGLLVCCLWFLLFVVLWRVVRGIEQIRDREGRQ